MISQVILWISIALMGLFAILFGLSRRAAPGPSRLKLRKNSSENFDQPIYDSSRTEVKNLNVIFMFNGHSFDAFEVLGIPAGSQRAAVDAAYKRALAQNQGQSQEFIETAYQALLKSFR